MPTSSSKRAADSLAAAIAAGIEGATRAMPIIGERIVMDVQASLSSPAAPSAPGSPPARRTGELLASYRSETGRDERGRHYVAVVSDDPAASYLEFGTSEMPARPHLRPAVAREVPQVGRTVAEAWAAEQRGRGK